jgi:sugar lactone lactonase YvrE
MANRYWVSTNTNKFFSVAAQESIPQGLFFKPDGTKMYVVGSLGDDVNEYNLSSAWDVSTASYLQNFIVNGQDTSPQDLFFKPDGTKMYILGGAGDDVNEYNLSSAWDVSTASYVRNFSVAAQETEPQGLFFKPDGTKMYVVGSSGDDVNEYNLSSAWDVSTASYLQNFSLGGNPQGIFFKPDGTKMYIIESVNDVVNEYNLSSAWDVSTASFLQGFTVNAQESSPTGVFFKDDGTTMYIIGTIRVIAYQYPLSSAWNISSISLDQWNNIAGTKWSETSGGAGGASVPTADDDVFFDSNSGQVLVAIDPGNLGAKSITCIGFTGELTGSAPMNLYGDITLAANMRFTWTGAITFLGTAVITSAGKNFGPVNLSGLVSTINLADAFSSPGYNFTVSGGIFNTNGYSFSPGAFQSDSPLARTINFGSSVVSIVNQSGDTFRFTNTSNLTFNAGTSQINIPGVNVNFRGGGQTFYNVTFTQTSGTTRTLQDSNTFNNLTFNTGTAGITGTIIFGNQTVNGTFTCSGPSVIGRGFVFSNTQGTPRTITAASVSANDCDFRDITIAGAAAPISPVRAGDCGGNSGITFPAAKTVYRVGTDTTWQGSSSWATASGGAGSNTNFPLPQDTAIIDNATTLTGTLALGTFNIGTLDCSARTTGITLNHSINVTRYGSYILGSGVTITGTPNQVFSGRGTMLFASAGKTVTFSIEVTSFAGTLQLADAFNSTNQIKLSQGTFSAGSYNVTCNNFDYQGSLAKILNMGSGLWTLTGTGNIWNGRFTSGGDVTINKGTADILLSSDSAASRNFFVDRKASSPTTPFYFNKITIGGSSTSVTVFDTYTLSGDRVIEFTELASTKTVPHTVRFTNYVDKGITIGTWSITGSTGNLVTVDSSVPGTRLKFDLINQTSGIDYLNVKDIQVFTPEKFYVGTNSIDSGNNLNVIFTATPSISSSVFYGGLNIGSIFYGSTPVTAVYYGSIKVF